jgi:hypothetical protein
LHPVEVLHFPYRSLDQYERKNLTSTRTYGSKALGQYTKGFEAHREGRIADVYRSLAVDDERLEHGLAHGSLVIDTRLRDTLRERRKQAAEPGTQEAAFAEEAALAVDALVIGEANLVRLQRRLDELTAREAAL